MSMMQPPEEGYEGLRPRGPYGQKGGFTDYRELPGDQLGQRDLPRQKLIYLTWSGLNISTILWFVAAIVGVGLAFGVFAGFWLFVQLFALLVIAATLLATQRNAVTRLKNLEPFLEVVGLLLIIAAVFSVIVNFFTAGVGLVLVTKLVACGVGYLVGRKLVDDNSAKGKKKPRR